jgi:thiosulfate reductase cytochrome b subunit
LEYQPGAAGSEQEDRKVTETARQTHEFKTEVQQLLKLIINSIYSNKTVFFSILSALAFIYAPPYYKYTRYFKLNTCFILHPACIFLYVFRIIFYTN